ncbi:hypothetical protein HK105_206219 [Polyrhizophydium stewartii]|uniref:Cyclin-like domain-containing protein n=1 Tax=Polyrhizophydium stewartii TaxID=2732419 RepID=A0ABR4N406_9FUNG|nr:Cyclin-L1 [Polyrhizophydium stewartii]
MSALSLANTQPTLAQLVAPPSQTDGVPVATERCLRILGAELINSASLLLSLPQVASSTAQVLFQRFFFCASFRDNSVLRIASACLFLSTKLEECPRKPRDLINVFNFLCQLRRGHTPTILDVDFPKYTAIKNDMMDGEMHLLAKLGFNVHVQHPHGFMINYLQSLDLTSNKELMQRAWNYLNDSGRTLAVVLFQPPTIAAASIYMAANDVGEPLPLSPPWWEVFDAPLEDLQTIEALLRTMYATKVPKSLPLEEPIQVAATR